MSYSEDDSNELTKIIARTADLPIDVTTAPPEKQIRMLRTLVLALDNALKIVDEAHYADPPRPEPYPGACSDVVKQSRAAVAIARKTGLIP